MLKIKTHYDSLNVSRNAPANVIKAAYKALCQNYHPDKYAGGADEALRIIKTINAAYTVLSDPVKKAEYDRWLHKQERDHAHHEAQRIMKAVNKVYETPSVKRRPKRPPINYRALYNRHREHVHHRFEKVWAISKQALTNINWSYGLAVVFGLVLFLGIAVYLYDLKTRPASNASVNQEIQALLKSAHQWVKEGHTEKALPIYLRLAEQGNTEAEFHLGLLYANGQGVPKDDKQAADWFTKAANQGMMEAQTKLGFMYAIGRGVPQNYTTAIYWCYKAAEQGDVIAQYNLGLMYAKGQGVVKDNNLAFSWYTKAAMQGDAHAQYNLGAMYANGEGVAKDTKQAAVWYRKAARQGLVEAITALKQLQ